MTDFPETSDMDCITLRQVAEYSGHPFVIPLASTFAVAFQSDIRESGLVGNSARSKTRRQIGHSW